MELNHKHAKKTLTWGTEVKITYVKIRGVKGEDGILLKGSILKEPYSTLKLF